MINPKVKEFIMEFDCNYLSKVNRNQIRKIYSNYCLDNGTKGQIIIKNKKD